VKWPKRNKDGRQELEIRLGNEHISFDVYNPSSNPLQEALATQSPKCPEHSSD